MYTEKKFEQLYKTYYEPLFRFAFAFLGDESASHDVVNDLFTYLWDKRPGVHPDKLEAYLYQSIRNRCLNVISKESTHRQLHQDYLRELAHTLQPEKLPEEWDSIQRFIVSELTPRDQEVLDLCYDQGLTYKQAAEQLQTTVNTINKHIKQSLRKLRERFNPKQKNSEYDTL